MALDIPWLLTRLTQEEKISLLTGANFWNTHAIKRYSIPSIMLTDGPHGLRKQAGKADNIGINDSIPATCFPTASALASSWDVDIVERVGKAIGSEAVAENVSVVLGPGLNIIRNPLGGRSFEYFSEDPLLSGDMAAAMTRGVQSLGIAACLKHFAVNSQEHLRMTINEIVDDRALHEIYLEGFRRAIKYSQPKAIMSAYNLVNGTHANENRELLVDTLRTKWGYDGLVVTDWGAEHDRVTGLKVGNQLEMPGSGDVSSAEIRFALKSGKLSEETLDENVAGILKLINDTRVSKKPNVDFDTHHKLAIEAAEKSAVLLKNDGILPLDKTRKIAVIGDFATKLRYQGAGSSTVRPTKLDDALNALNWSDVNVVGYAQGFKRFGGESKRLTKQALQVAIKSDTVLLFLGLDEVSEAEGVDRDHMMLNSNQLQLLQELKKVQENIVVVLSNGAPVEIPFVSDVRAILLAHLGGQGSGSAVSNILTGKTNPSGKLAVTYPIKYSDVPSARYYPGKEKTSEHRESIYVGYRYYDTTQTEVRYPFGHGLSYTTFAYSGFRATKAKATITVANSGRITGEEVVQIYISSPAGTKFVARKELKGFAKVRLKPGESKQVEIPLDDHAFCYYDTRRSKFETIGGKYIVSAGSSSRDLRAVTSVVVGGSTAPSTRGIPKPYLTGEVRGASSVDFSTLAGYSMPNSRWNRRLDLTEYDCMAQFVYAGFVGRLILRGMHFARKVMAKSGKRVESNNIFFIVNMPLYKFERLTQGRVTRARINSLVKIANWGRKH